MTIARYVNRSYNKCGGDNMPVSDRDTERIWATMSKERYEQLRQWADELGIQFSQYIALVAWMGAAQLRRTMHPEQYIPPEVMADAIARATSQAFTPEVMSQALSQAIVTVFDKLSSADVGEMVGASANDPDISEKILKGMRAMQEEDDEQFLENVRRMNGEREEDMKRMGENLRAYGARGDV